MGRFDGKAVIVTGSSNGIGRATAHLFAREGASVTICGRNEVSLNESKELLLTMNGNDEKKIVVVRGDVCDEEVMKQIIDKTVQQFGRLDVLVNNAGGTYGSISVDHELEGDLSTFDYTLNANMRSVLRLCQLAYPHLIQTKAVPFPFYSISKAAQDQLTRNLAIHYIRKGVRVNSVNPGIISTNIIQKQGFTDDVVKKVSGTYP
ncbi:oxidoreductase, short chain dehydrogenase/reductase family protein [Ancylostoma duodenale]|uniref:Oxidoreductase, short chain dehydrogenase/reductase family protein n=1 Tax=Ancylostoma duodenale TaxID=51022 RepID=A0A0C2H3Y4_9BILA|nr:oxidoreductase, short chain dehydrogenase/reductase family protein [Ancylostoma duodenale]